MFRTPKGIANTTRKTIHKAKSATAIPNKNQFIHFHIGSNDDFSLISISLQQTTCDPAHP